MSFVGATYASAWNTVSSLTGLVFPTGLRDGDHALLLVAGLATDFTPALPAGWTLLARNDRTGICSALYGRKVTAAMSGQPVSLGLGASTPSPIAGIFVIRGYRRLGPVAKTNQGSTIGDIQVPPYSPNYRHPFHLIALARSQAAAGTLQLPTGKNLRMLASDPAPAPTGTADRRTGLYFAGRESPGMRYDRAAVNPLVGPYPQSSQHYATSFLIEATPENAPRWWAFDPIRSTTAYGNVAPVDPATYPLYDRLTRHPRVELPDGKVGTIGITTQTGQPWGQYSGPGRIYDNGYDSPEGTGAVYLEADAGGIINRLGARWVFDTLGGTRTSPANGRSTMTLVSWADGGIADKGFNRRSRCHLTITPTGITMFVRATQPGTNETVVNIGGFPINPPLPLDQTVEAEVWINTAGTTATARLSNGQVFTWTDSRFASREGESWACFEPYYGAGDGTDPRIRISEVWASVEGFEGPITDVPVQELPPTSEPNPVPPSSGGGETTPPVTAGDPVATSETLHLPFDMPERQLLTASEKKVYAHYFTPYPRSINNTPDPYDATDWYHNRWIGRQNSTGNATTGAPDGPNTPNSYGGMLRDRPIPRAQRPTGWQVADKVDEVNWARDAGYDGWMLDMLGVGSGNNRWTQQLEMHAAIEASGHTDFGLGLMPDANTSAANSVTTLAENIAAVMSRASTLRTADGRLIIAPYKPETKGPAFWEELLANLRARGENPYFVPCFEQNWVASPQAPAHAYLADGMARWGDRDPNAVRSTSNQNAGAVAFMRATYPGKIWMHPVSPGDERPVGIGSSRYWERWGLENWRAAWTVAIDTDADWVQIPTWNDISEHSHIVPSINHGFSYLDVGAYYLIRYKLGYWPKIKRDAGYLAHRIRPTWTAPSQGQPSAQIGYQGMTSWQTLAGATPHYDDVELVTFLTEAAEVQITSGGQTTTHQVAAGVQRTVSTIKGTGQVSARIVRGGQTVQTIVSEHPVVATPWVQDMNYRITGGLRQALAGGPPPVTTPPTTTPAEPVVQTVDVKANTYVEQRAPSTNFSTSAQLSSRAGADEWFTYLRHALPAAPAGMVLTGARFLCRTTTDSTANTTGTSTLQIITAPLDEATVTYTTRPTSFGAVVGTLGAMTALNTAYSFALDPAALRPLLGQDLITVLRGDTNDSLRIYSGTSQNGPKLELTFTAA